MAKKSIFAIVTILILLSMSVAPVFAGEVGPVDPLTPAPSAENGVMTDETPQLWFVELSSAPTADGTSLATVNAEKAAFRLNAKRVGLTYTERYTFNTLFNGLSISIQPSDLGKLARTPGVKNIYPVETIPMPVTTPSDPDLFTSLTMIGADTAQSELGFTGEGIKVAVMDTGIDVNHPAFGGNGVAETNSSFFFESPRVLAGYDFVGDAFNAAGSGAALIPHPDNNPDDCAGHGSHVAGIIGANDPTNGLKGVAPDVTFGAYRVFGCVGSTTADIMVAAMEMALADGMQVLNMSIGSAYQWPQYPTAVAATRLVNKGMVVVASIGNEGANGLYSAGAPGLGEKVIGVASYDNSNIILPYFTVNGRDIGYMTMTYSASAPLSGSAEIVYVGRGCVDGDLTVPGNQTDPYLANPAGKTALIVRGVCGFAEKAIRAINAGATAVVVYNNTTGVVAGTLGAPIGSSVPVVGISQADGLFIIAQVAPIMMTWTDQQASFPSPTGGLISSFSSYGLSPDLALKPDIGAPGGNIYSSYPLEKGAYTTMSGTSMSSPHVAGAAALLLQARPNTSAQAVRGILQNSADPANWWGNPGLGFLDNVNRQGAGMLDIDDAILATTKITPAKIATGESQAGPFVQQLSIENIAETEVTYDLSFVNALSVRNTFSPAASTSNASVTFNQSSVTVPAGGTASVMATINPATAPNKAQYGGYIVFTPQGGGQVYRVPFAGFVGDYQSIQVLAPTANGFPWLAVRIGSQYYGPVTGPEDWTYTMQGNDIPFFLVHFDHQSRLFRMEIFGENGKAWHRVYNEEYMGRNSTSTGFFALPFDGTTYAGKWLYTVPDGTYYAVITVLKANGDANNPADWETWPSPLFVIDRP